MQSFSRRYTSRLTGSTFKIRTSAPSFAATLLFSTAVATPVLHAQAISVNGGSIQGTITDPSGAAVPNAQVTAISKDDGTQRKFTTDRAGFYSIGPLDPGNYTLSVVAPGFEELDVETVIRLGTSTPGTFKLSVASE